MTVEIDITMRSIKHGILVTEHLSRKISSTDMAGALEELAKRIRNGECTTQVQQMDWSFADLDNKDTRAFFGKHLSEGAQ